MIDVKSRWKSLTSTEKRAAGGASFMAKAKATKAVWFPPKPVEAGKTAASAAKKATKGATKKTTGAAKKTTNRTRGVTNPVRRKKT